jgi:hypothetical protein
MLHTDTVSDFKFKMMRNNKVPQKNEEKRKTKTKSLQWIQQYKFIIFLMKINHKQSFLVFHLAHV